MQKKIQQFLSSYLLLLISIFSVNLKEHKWRFVVEIDELKINADYQMKGRILVLPIEGKGASEIRLGEFLKEN